VRSCGYKTNYMRLKNFTQKICKHINGVIKTSKMFCKKESISVEILEN